MGAVRARAVCRGGSILQVNKLAASGQWQAGACCRSAAGPTRDISTLPDNITHFYSQVTEFGLSVSSLPLHPSPPACCMTQIALTDLQSDQLVTNPTPADLKSLTFYCRGVLNVYLLPNTLRSPFSDQRPETRGLGQLTSTSILLLHPLLCRAYY